MDEVEKNNAAPGQPTTQKPGAKATTVDLSELENDYPSAKDDTQQQANAVVQREKVGEANKTAAGNQKRGTRAIIPPKPNQNQRTEMLGVVHKRKRSL